MARKLPAGIGIVLKSRDYGGAGSYYVQTPDRLWSIMYARMQKQVDKRNAALSQWEAMNKPDGYPPVSYWTAYNVQKGKHRVDYPMPWGHVMFEGKEG